MIAGSFKIPRYPYFTRLNLFQGLSFCSRIDRLIVGSVVIYIWFLLNLDPS